MTISEQTYHNTDEEYREICDFLNILTNQDPNSLWESGRMNFWRYTVHAQRDPQDRFFRDNVRFWAAENGEVAALCISEYGKNDLFVEVLPGYEQLYPEIFHWIENTWASGRENIEIDIFADDKKKITRLEQNGFTFSQHIENKRTYNLEQIPLDYHLEPGFQILTFSEMPDYAGRVALVQSAFNNPGYSEKKLKGLIASPDYIAEYHLMVVSPEKLPVAYCVGWHDRAKENCGYIEPVGTHAHYRQRGFAKAIIRECYQRMKANGIKMAEIASSAEPAAANYLYEALSPQSKREVHRYVKNLS